jgi:site-specific recombinase XerD
MKEVRGFAPSTVNFHLRTTDEFLSFIGYEDFPNHLETLSIEDIEGFLIAVGKRLGRGTMQHVVAVLRALLRYLVLQETIASGLENQIETPRHYRFEQLPRSLPWKTVQALLQSIDQSIPMGIRDYSMFILLTTYGLRASEVVSLTLDDIDWRTRQLKIPQKKTGKLLVLPLTDEVATSFVNYLKNVRPVSSHRQVFLRVRAPIGILKPTAVNEIFQRWSKLSGLPIPFQGTHCLRHSYAVYLLQQGTPLKTIGDILGHRDAESTCVYLRLNNDELRQVALPIPGSSSQKKEQPS